MTQIHNKKQFTTYILLILVIIVIFNIALRSLFFRIDLTKNNIFSLSNSSKIVIKKLDDRMIAKVFFSENLPGQYANSRRYLQDILEEYQAYSKGRFHFEFINPDQDEEAMQEAQSFRIPPVQLQVIENDKMEVKKVYMGLVLLYNDKNEVLPVIQNTTGLEYDLTAAIKKLTSSEMNVVGLYSGNNDVSTENFQQILRQTYNVRSVGLANKIPDNINTLLVHGIRDSLSLDELYNLDQYVLRGGKLFIGSSRINADFQKGIGHEIKTNLHNFLENYGVQIGKELVFDRICEQIQIQQQQGFFSIASSVAYPPFIKVQNFNKDNIIVKNLEQVWMFFTNPIVNVKNDDSFVSLMKSSNASGFLNVSQKPSMDNGMYTMVHGYDISPDIKDSPQNSNPGLRNFSAGPQTLAALVKGNFTSFFADSIDKNQEKGFIQSTNEGEIVVVGVYDFFNDKTIGGIQTNMNFIINTIDYLAGDDELIEIRSRGVTSRPLDELSKSSRSFWKWLNILLPTILLILYGLFRMRLNREKRKVVEVMYGK